MTDTEQDSVEGLICGYLIEPTGHGRLLGWEEVNSWSPSQGLIWVHLDFTQPGAHRWLEGHSGLEPNIVDALLADDGRPRSLQQGDNWLVMLRGVNRNPGAEADDMVAIRVWLEANRIISTRRRRLQSIRDVRAAIETGKAPLTAGDFLVI